ncbi:ECF RNA polymerase sigma factor SigW [Rubrobacter xylanophilus DSM 9941]|uniref:RNA polymerase sigma factor n=1 Tax=Rubrobacter xylanophilus TaxID=49319 RepID=UPI001C63C26C|nr:RNA polymerase sigma factor [Rubrobacter xylanophilus]QYJ17103.1 ECF RNA polymerase sigma factor SigW [Rubrobacter xylanophilus DSM 9941]
MRIAGGDPGAVRDLVERHYGELYRYAFAMLGHRAASEDAVHDAFVRALEALGKYPEKRIRAMVLRPWLYRITLNVVRDRLRRRRREIPLEGVRPAVEPQEDPEGVMDVLAALQSLPERQRVAVALRYLQDLPYAEISAATGWPEGTAKTLVRRGLIRLRAEMDGRRGGGL